MNRTSRKQPPPPPKGRLLSASGGGGSFLTHPLRLLFGRCFVRPRRRPSQSSYFQDELHYNDDDNDDADHTFLPKRLVLLTRKELMMTTAVDGGGQHYYHPPKQESTYSLGGLSVMSGAKSTLSVGGGMSVMSGASALWLSSSRSTSSSTTTTFATNSPRRSKKDGRHPLFQRGGNNHHRDDGGDDTTSTCDTEASCDIYIDHTTTTVVSTTSRRSTMETIVKHLSPSNNANIHVLGLTLLLETIETEGQQQEWLGSPPSVSDAAFALLYGSGSCTGGQEEEDAGHIQRLVGSFIYGKDDDDNKVALLNRHHDHDNDDDDDDDDRSFRSLPATWNGIDCREDYHSDNDDDSQRSDDDESRRRRTTTTEGGALLEVRALQVLSISLHQLLLAEEDMEEDDTMMMMRRRILRPLEVAGSRFWKRVIGSLVETLQNFDSLSPDLVEHSLTVVRLLHTLDPQYMTPVLTYLLLPYLSEIKEHAIENKLVAMASEADRVLNYQRSECYGVEV